MEYLLVMSLSGTTMTAIYLLMRRLLWDKISARVFYLLAKVAILYYLIPLPFLKKWYREAITWMFLREGQVEATHISLTWTNYAVHAEGKLYVNIYMIIQMVIIVGFVLRACYRITIQLLDYVRTAHFIAGYAERKMTDRHRKVIDGFKEEYGVKRPIVLHQVQDRDHTKTFGVWRPIIVCNKEPSSREAELMIRHEMVHIKRLDVFWEILLEFMTFFHWWNPIMWKLYRDFERVCECSCDETVMQGKSREEVKEYLRLLIEEAREKKDTKEKPETRFKIKWKKSFGENALKIRERMDNLMKNKKWNRFAAGVLVAALTFANSMTVFAYRDVLHVEVSADAPQDDIETHLDKDTFEFVSDEIDEEVVQEFELLDDQEIRYDRQFTDERGNIYQMNDDDSIEPHCNHNFVSGTAAEHGKLSGGGCEVIKYRAQRCTKCGYVILGERISVTTYDVCPH